MEISNDIILYFINHIDLIQELTKNVLNEYHSQKMNELFYGKTDRNRIVVLGAFDTWPYMDYICRILSKENYIALTSRFIYHKLYDSIVRFPSTEITQLASTDLSMKRLLKKIINSSLLAIINYSVSAAHYIETDWCEGEPELDYIGIAHVRDTHMINNCENLEIRELEKGLSFYSICKAIESSKSDWNAWDCIKTEGFCPFKQQDISKNVLEYYFNKDKNLKLIAYNNLEDLPEIIQTELEGKIEEIKNEEQEKFDIFFSNFNLSEKEIDVLLIYKGLEFLIFLKKCLILFRDFINKISSKMLDLFELIYDIVENIPSSEKKLLLEFHLNQLEKDYSEDIQLLREIFTGKNDLLLDFINGLSTLKANIYNLFGGWIIFFLINNEFIKESGAFWELSEKSEELFSSLNLNSLVDKHLNQKIQTLL